MNKKVILYIVVVVVILVLLLFTIFPGMIHAVKDAVKTGEEKCLPAPGYTEVEWREHMSHHPDIYRECLE